MTSRIERERTVLRFMDRVEALVSKSEVRSQVPEIVERMERLQRSGMTIISPLHEVNGGEAAVFQNIGEYPSQKGSKEGECLKFYPAYLEDAQLGKKTSYRAEQASFAAYRCHNHLIQANMQTPETPRFLACAFLHELGHAQAAEDEGRAFKKGNRSIEERLAEEIQIWTTEYRLMVALGGQTFAEAISFAAIDLMDAFRREETVSFEGWGKPLSSCVGPPFTKQGEQHRDYSFGIYCQFFLADHYLGQEERQQHKIKVLESSYASSYEKEKSFDSLS